MKLIKKGNNPDNEVWKGTCTYCSSQYEANKSELSMNYSQRGSHYGTADCIVCKKEMSVIFYPTIKDIT